MPLEVHSGRTISMSLGGLALVDALGGQSLNVPFLEQKQSQWCWAACIQMLLQKDGDVTTQQCNLANAAFELNGCCSAPSSSLCDQPLPIAQVSSEWERYGYGSSYAPGSVNINTVKFEIGSQRAIEVGLKWNSGGGHAILIVGWDEGDYVVFRDPANGPGSSPIGEVITAFGQGQWGWSWTGIKKGT
ncbi:MAG TPA: papain-like cysteine protease family protein [Gemmataceae bacterium]|jgi:hypothetical protein